MSLSANVNTMNNDPEYINIEESENGQDIDLDKLATMDEAFSMLKKLSDTKDPDETKEVMREVDDFISENMSNDKQSKDDNFVDKFNKTSINSTIDAKTRQKKAEKLKQEGNICFEKGDYARSVELYTSSIMEWDENPLVFTNRAQARIRMGQFQEAVQDCRQAIKLKPDLIKAQIHLSRALKGLGDYQGAIDVLEIAEECSSGYEEVISGYKRDVIQQMKHSMISKAGSMEKQ